MDWEDGNGIAGREADRQEESGGWAFATGDEEGTQPRDWDASHRKQAAWCIRLNIFKTSGL